MNAASAQSRVHDPLQCILFPFFICLKDYVNILATSKTNFLKRALFNYWAALKSFEYPFDAFDGWRSLAYLKHCRKLQFLLLTQHQVQLSEFHPATSNYEDGYSLIAFLDELHSKLPMLAKRLRALKLLAVSYDKGYKQHCIWGTLINLDKYSVFLENGCCSNNDTDAQYIVAKYPNLQIIATHGSLMMQPHELEYISQNSRNIKVVDIENMANSDGEGVFQALFSNHNGLAFLRVRAALECASISAITASDFDVDMKQLQFLSIENNTCFRWDISFLSKLKTILSAENLKFLYLTRSGMRLFAHQMFVQSPFDELEQHFPNAIIQKQQLRKEWYTLSTFTEDKKN